ncbi:MAG: ABC transporter permease, partial [Anaerolineales bacterium]
MNTRRLFGLMRKEFIQFFRDKALVILIIYVFLEIALCGWALTLDVKNMPAAVYDADRSTESQALLRAFSRLDNFNLVEYVENPGAVDALMDSGEAQVVFVIPAGFSRALASGDTAEVQLLVDGSNGAIAGQALAITGGLLREYNQEITLTKVARSGQTRHAFLPQVKNLVRIWYMPQLKYVHFVMLTMLAISVLILGVIIPAAGIVREKEAGTFEQLMITPITGAELIIAKIIPMLLVKLVGLSLG